MNEQPVSLSLQDDQLLIEWSDGQRRRYDPTELRRNCPCATCAGARSGTEYEGRLPAAGDEPVTIRAMRPVGNYAYNIVFSDGHDTGLFGLDLLRQLGGRADEE